MCIIHADAAGESVTMVSSPLFDWFKSMRYLYWLIKFMLFVIMFGFAMHNADSVTLKFFLGYSWQAPLALLLLVFFVVGAVFGLLAAFAKIIRLRREIVSLKKELRSKQTLFESAPDLLVEQPRDAL